MVMAAAEQPGSAWTCGPVPTGAPRSQAPVLGVKRSPSSPWRSPRRGEQGYNLVVLVMIITVMTILLSAALPLWSQAIRRNKEEELIFRGLQYAEAIRLFHNRFQRYPTSLEELLKVKPRCIRQLWKDPMTDDGKWQLIFEGREGVGVPGIPNPSSPPAPDLRPTGKAPLNPNAGIDQEGHSFGPIKGVYSRSTKKSIAIWNGQKQYDQWRFNADLLTGGGRTASQNGGGAAVPTGSGQPQLSVRWLGRPWRTFGGLQDSRPPGAGEQVFRPNLGLGTATPGAPGVQRTPPPPPK
jgi:type II secretory pathway pseudopilin PulG